MGDLEKEATDILSEAASSADEFANEAANTISKGIENAAEGIFGTVFSSTPSSSEIESIMSTLATIGADGSTTSADSTSAAEYHLGDDNKWGWITLYIVTIVFAILGNFMFLVAAACTTRVRTTGYYLLINLSIRDILLAGLCMPFALDYEIIHLSWIFGTEYCICFRFFYYCFLFFLPLTILFLTFHLFVENCKWNFAGEEGFVPRPWTHSIYIPLIWFFSALFAFPTSFFSKVRDEADDFYGNDIAGRPDDAKACLHRGGPWSNGSTFFYIASSWLTFCIPVILLVIPWFALLVQICSCCTRKLGKSELWLSVITLLLILLWEASRTPLKLYNIHHILTEWEITQLKPFIPPVNSEIYKALMKWAVYAPAAIHPFIYFAFSPEVRHGLYILFSRCCSCCCSSSTSPTSLKSEDSDVASDDEKGRMLPEDDTKGNNGPTSSTIMAPTVTTTTETIGTTDSEAVPLQSKQEEEM